MPRIELVTLADNPRVMVAVSIWSQAPALPLKGVMMAAGFCEADASSSPQVWRMTMGHHTQQSEDGRGGFEGEVGTGVGG